MNNMSANGDEFVTDESAKITSLTSKNIVNIVLKNKVPMFFNIKKVLRHTLCPQWYNSDSIHFNSKC